MKNIVLTGFMASGKTTVGKEIAKITNKRFVDTDALIEEEAGMPISEIFENFGEGYFRDLETVSCMTAAGENGSIISTGGGTVLRKENMDILRKNGIIFNLEMTEALIAERLEKSKDTRPLMKDGLSGVIARYNQRKPFYENADFKIALSEKTPTEIAGEILKLFEAERIREELCK